MNDRIEKLMLDATKDMPQEYYVPGVYFEQFAELIVQECIRVIRADYVDLGTTAAVNNIEKHFGVEE